MKRFLRQAATVAKWAAILIAVGLVSGMSPLNGLLLADVITDAE